MKITPNNESAMDKAKIQQMKRGSRRNSTRSKGKTHVVR